MERGGILIFYVTAFGLVSVGVGGVDAGFLKYMFMKYALQALHRRKQPPRLLRILTDFHCDQISTLWLFEVVQQLPSITTEPSKNNGHFTSRSS